MDGPLSANSTATTPDLTSSTDTPIEDHSKSPMPNLDYSSWDDFEWDDFSWIDHYSSNISTAETPNLTASSDGPTAPKMEHSWRSWRSWTRKEYEIMIKLQTEGKSWEEMHGQLPGRDAEECRKQWEVGGNDLGLYKVSDSNGPTWHPEEEAILVKCCSSEGRKSGQLKAAADLLPARTVAGCNNHWYSVLRHRCDP